MFEELGFENLTAPEVAVYAALVIGLTFGAIAQITRFCFRRALVGEDRKDAWALWLTALAVAVLGTQALVSYEVIDLSSHRFATTNIPVLAIAVGGLLFGAGMVLTRGCISRLTVLTGSGNMRALTVLLIFGLVAHATLKGVLSPLRVWFGQVTYELPLETAYLSDFSNFGLIFGLVLLGFASARVLRSGNSKLNIALVVVLGALVPLAFATTGFVLLDEFDPIATEGLSFTAPLADSLFFTIASTAIAPNFGAGLVGGVLVGAFASALIRREFSWHSFESNAQTGRYLTGAVFMGFGGVLAGGCTVGAGLSGIPTLSISAILATAFIALGALAMQRILERQTQGAAPVGLQMTPAE